jgi:glycerol-3-phosphate dehydrogenase
VSVPTPDLNAARRMRDLGIAEAGHIPDVLVIGGGITGCGVALDAASRGLDVILVEAHDLAFGTSRWSSKLVHGGLRYLAHGDVGVAWESAVERSRLMTTIAPHLIRPLPHVMPLDADRKQRALVRAGLRAADALRAAAGTSRRVLPRPRTISAEQARRLVPAIASASLTGATVHWDGQLIDDARLTVAVARTSARLGARIITGARATDVTGDGARILTREGMAFDIRARHVIVAAGVWAQSLDPSTQITASRGSHVLLRPDALGHPRAALTVPVQGERGRYVFALPTLDGHVVAGITDEPMPGPIPDVPTAPTADVDWILEHLSRALDGRLDADDVIGTYAGVRPLVGDGDAQATADISRRHLVERRPEGYVVVTGGKLTTYRRMAEDAVDALGIPALGACRTATLPLVGAGRRGPHDVTVQPGAVQPGAVPRRLVDRFGTEASRVASYADGDPSLLAPVSPGVPTLGVEVIHAVRCEGALDIDDVMERRTRLSLVPSDADRARHRVAEIVESIR